MTLKNDLEIVLATYNREKFLLKTLQALFAENSPVRDLDITILNNASTDKTLDILNTYQKKFKNMTVITNPINIGGNANIARAFEIATHKYLWVLCDDDNYDFSGWAEVEKAIKDDYDAVVVDKNARQSTKYNRVFKMMTFVPAVIYKTDFISDTVMTNVEFCISSMFPHLAVGAAIINEKGRIYVCKNGIVIGNIADASVDYKRGLNDNAHPYMVDYFWILGFANASLMIKDKKIRNKLIRINHIRRFVRINANGKLSAGKNWLEMFGCINWSKKMYLIFYSLLYYTIFRISAFDKKKGKVNL